MGVSEMEMKGVKMAAVTVSFINMKGGVGKTTLAMQIAHAADVAGYRVLAVDLDPQSNLSQSLMGARSYVKYLRSHEPTIAQIFDLYRPATKEDPCPKPIDVHDAILKSVGYPSMYSGASTLDLIPSRLEFSRTLKNPTGKEHRLAKALSKVHGEYDLILVDCAPTESILTEAAYFASRYVVVPVKPEYMATIGLPLLARSLEEFAIENDDHEIEIAGVVFNHSSSYSTGPEGQASVADVRREAKEHSWPVFEGSMKYSASYARAAREGTPLPRTPNVQDHVIRGFRKVQRELFEAIGLKKETE